MSILKQLLILTFIPITLFGCQINSDLIRPAYYSVTYSKGDAMLAANSEPIKVNVLVGADKSGLAMRVSEGLNKYGPKWLNARYTPSSNHENKSPYQMKWAFDITEDGNAAALCGKQSSDLQELVPSTGVVLAAFCLRNKTLTSARARFVSPPDSEKFLQTVGSIGRELLVIQNPVRDNDCWVISDC
ncbi:MAG: hypothetical protein V7776_01235 [Halopseudomonas aestusnigri]